MRAEGKIHKGRGGGNRRLMPTALVTALVAAFFALSGAAPATAQLVTTAEISALNNLTMVRGDLYASGIGRANLDFESTGNRMVRSRLQLSAVAMSLSNAEDSTQAPVQFSTIQVPRAEIRWRIPLTESFNFRATTGRTRLSWGDGIVFNAGDIINGVAPSGSLDLTAETLRDETQWLIETYLPLGRFGFAEPVLIWPMGTYGGGAETETDGETDAGSGTSVVDPATMVLGSTGVAPATDLTAGGRIHGKIGQLKTEAGYLYEGRNDVHRPYVSLQGNLLVDWYLSGSVELPEDPADVSYVSGGIYHTAQTPAGSSWSFRVEGLFSAPDRVDVFGEITWAPSQLFSLVGRSQMEIATDNTNSAVGVNWLPATGLTLGLYTSVVSGDLIPAEAGGNLATSITAAAIYSF